MEQSWKNTLYTYVYYKNRVETQYPRDEMFPLVFDEHALRRQRSRLERVRRQYQERGASPQHSEIRLTIRSVTAQPTRVKLEIGLRQKIMYTQQSRQFELERLEQETVTLSFAQQQWKISKIEESIPERRPLSLRPELPYDTADGRRPPAAPFLNRSMLAPELALRRNMYDREKAAQYADRWWNGVNPDFIGFDVDCTNFVSQCLYAGGAPMNYTGKRESGWWYQGRSGDRELWSFSWSVSHSLQLLLARGGSQGLRAVPMDRAGELDIGDVIVYDWDGDGRYQHSAIVTAFDGGGMPLVNAHTANSRHRYWDYRDSYAWTPQTTYRFFHIVDHF